MRSVGQERKGIVIFRLLLLLDYKIKFDYSFYKSGMSGVPFPVISLKEHRVYIV
jgi:hypothetical protein